VKPQLARTLGPKFSSWPCYVQPKLNGVRALYQHQPNYKMDSERGFFQSRDEKTWSHKVLNHLHIELESIQPMLGDLILDGELYVHGWRLQDINAAIAVNRKEPTDKTPSVCFHVFDIVDPNRNFSSRWFEIYHGLLSAELPHVKAVPTALSNSREEMEQHFHLYTREGYEGIMLRPDGPYEFGEHLASHGRNMTTFRSKFLWKHKAWEDDEFVCEGVTQGEGKANIGIGALVLYASVDYENPILFKVGTGFTDEERIEFAKNPPLGKMVKVRYLCLTADGIPFNPSFMCIM
jgi:ATP-dependent DNA ligase